MQIKDLPDISLLQIKKTFTWLWNKYSKTLVKRELAFWGVYGVMAGLHGFEKNGSWHIGFYSTTEKET